mmetsp:Transcript_2311/g.3346  ORF Transcript_2311/g.3346 Transcript_2311/m.3346 type:complete len:731 (-) Transcript_2311:2375-4567(-)
MILSKKTKWYLVVIIVVFLCTFFIPKLFRLWLPKENEQIVKRVVFNGLKQVSKFSKFRASRHLLKASVGLDSKILVKVKAKELFKDVHLDVSRSNVSIIENMADLTHVFGDSVLYFEKGRRLASTTFQKDTLNYILKHLDYEIEIGGVAGKIARVLKIHGWTVLMPQQQSPLKKLFKLVKNNHVIQKEPGMIQFYDDLLEKSLKSIVIEFDKGERWMLQDKQVFQLPFSGSLQIDEQLHYEDHYSDYIQHALHEFQSNVLFLTSPTLLKDNLQDHIQSIRQLGKQLATLKVKDNMRYVHFHFTPFKETSIYFDIGDHILPHVNSISLNSIVLNDIYQQLQLLLPDKFPVIEPKYLMSTKMSLDHVSKALDAIFSLFPQLQRVHFLSPLFHLIVQSGPRYLSSTGLRIAVASSSLEYSRYTCGWTPTTSISKRIGKAQLNFKLMEQTVALKMRQLQYKPQIKKDNHLKLGSFPKVDSVHLDSKTVLSWKQLDREYAVAPVLSCRQHVDGDVVAMAFSMAQHLTWLMDVHEKSHSFEVPSCEGCLDLFKSFLRSNNLLEYTQEGRHIAFLASKELKNRVIQEFQEHIGEFQVDAQYHVTNMNCEKCREKVRALLLKKNVIEPLVDLKRKLIVFQSSRLIQKEVEEALGAAKFTIQSSDVPIHKHQFVIENMNCEKCKRKVTGLLEDDGVVVDVNLSTKQVSLKTAATLKSIKERLIQNNFVLKRIKKDSKDL